MVDAPRVNSSAATTWTPIRKVTSTSRKRTPVRAFSDFCLKASARWKKSKASRGPKKRGLSFVAEKIGSQRHSAILIYLYVIDSVGAPRSRGGSSAPD